MDESAADQPPAAERPPLHLWATEPNRAMLDAVVESLPFRVWACDHEGRCILQNSASVRDFGPFVGHKATDLPLPPEQIAKWQEGVSRALAGEVVWTEAAIPLGGQVRSYHYVVAPIREGAATRGVVGVDIDITDLRRAQAALATSEQRLRCVTENAPDIILQIGRNGRITYINRVMPEFDPTSVIGSNVLDWIPPAFRPVVQGAIDQVFERGEPCRYETEGLSRGGELAWYSSRISPVMLDGEVNSAIIISTDMTDAQRAEAALRESEERFRQLASSIDEGFWLIALDPERLLYVNPAFERIWGVPAETLYKQVRGGEARIHPEHRAKVQEAFNDWLAGYKEAYDVEYRIVRPDGHTRWIHDRGARIFDARGKFYRASGIVRDVTEQKLAEQTIRDSEERYRLLADHSSDLISRHRPDGRWLYVSPASQSLMGFAPEQLIGQDPFEYMHPDDISRCKSALADMARTLQPQSATFRSRRADGVYLWFEAHGRAIVDASGALTEIVVTSRDVTERIEATRKLRQREADLAHAERLSTMGQMAAELAHEMNQPLYAIANFAEACLGKLARLQSSVPNAAELPDLTRWLTQISQQSRRAGDVVRRMTHFVRKGELDRERLDLNELVRNIAPLLEVGVRGQGASIEYDLAPRLSSVVADRLLIEQVVVNLVRNAAEVMEETPAEERHLVVMTYEAEEGLVGVAVSDSGRGIQPSELERLFEPYFTTKSDGTGMGLAICRSTIEAHQGRIWATNNADRGATFQFVLPAAQA